MLISLETFKQIDRSSGSHLLSVGDYTCSYSGVPIYKDKTHDKSIQSYLENMEWGNFDFNEWRGAFHVFIVIYSANNKQRKEA